MSIPPAVRFECRPPLDEPVGVHRTNERSPDLTTGFSAAAGVWPDFVQHLAAPTRMARTPAGSENQMRSVGAVPSDRGYGDCAGHAGGRRAERGRGRAAGVAARRGADAAASRGSGLVLAVRSGGDGRGGPDLEPGRTDPRRRDAGRRRAVAADDRAGRSAGRGVGAAAGRGLVGAGARRTDGGQVYVEAPRARWSTTCWPRTAGASTSRGRRCAATSPSRWRTRACGSR